MNRLCVGSGRSKWPDWQTLDANPACQPDYVATVPPFPDEVARQRWDEVAAIHFIEHLPLWKAEEFARCVHAMLKPGGRLTLEQPNIEYCARVILGLETPQEAFPGQCGMGGFYGDVRQKDTLMCHLWGWTPQTLSAMLAESGFHPDNIETLPARYHRPDRDFRIVARK